jgi:hypothetical protein
MSRFSKSAANNIQNSEDLSSNLSINKKSKTIKRANELAEVKNEDIRQNCIWNINSILSNIFAYSDHKDLLKFNAVCKKWNNITNPIIHKTIKLDYSWNGSTRYCYNRIGNAAKIDADVVECISNNVRHAHLVKEFCLDLKLKPLRAIELFETFRFICKLSIGGCDMAQGRFLGMINPLTQLQELAIYGLTIKNIIRKNFYNEVVQLPSSLKKLTLGYIELIDNPELFIQTINSHSNLVEFSANSSTNNELLKPLYKHYPSLSNFEYDNQYQQTPQHLFEIFENNPQLISLDLSLQRWSNELVSHISSYLINLEQLKISENNNYNRDNTDFIVKFSQPTKIKKLNLDWSSLSNCSLNSILLNCPDLEELELNSYSHYKQPNSIRFFNLSNPNKLKKLSIECDALGEDIFNTLLLKCPHINELSVSLPVKWKETIKSIYERCDNLQRLEISSPRRTHEQHGVIFLQEFYETEFFTCNPKCRLALTHLTLNGFKAAYSKAEYFKKFKSLKSIKYMPQNIFDYNYSNENSIINMDLWPGYKLFNYDNLGSNGIEFKRY